MLTVRTNIAGIPARLELATDSVLTRENGPRIFVGEFMPDVPADERPYNLRSAYESSLETVLTAMAWDAALYTGHPEMNRQFDWH